MNSSPGVLFLCVANSARSQMAEGIARKLAPAGTAVASAGSSPSQVNPLAIAAMSEIGIDISDQRSTAVADVDPNAVGTVITLCAEEVCPAFLGAAERHHWPMPDPAAVPADGPDGRERALAEFRRVRDQLYARIAVFFGHAAMPDASATPAD
ncbi:MAG: arsenate reductase (thioredoxin) [Haliangiales bacterium]